MTGFELGTDGPGTILTAVDGSITSLRAGAYAAGLARRQHAHLLVVTVATTPAMAAMAPGALAVLSETAQDLATDVQAQARRYLEDLSLTGELVQVAGDPYTEIVRLADERRVDGVVVGASAKAGHRIVGSLAGRLVRAGKWPVTVVP
ncbi:universal stress protein [Actinomycetospora chibensis]|uniref:Universal stress protein n=1 Tax=Actinomycetospora chibensis TaxID=663606 RepID=A0ABV9RHC3_9PSEU|nr:universal stress protein [Actinomycetospora chibensis]MDD7923607.1 universal stress protein [Actinomycetospora chibensis]